MYVPALAKIFTDKKCELDAYEAAVQFTEAVKAEWGLNATAFHAGLDKETLFALEARPHFEAS